MTVNDDFYKDTDVGHEKGDDGDRHTHSAYQPGQWVRLHGGQADGQLAHIPPGRISITITVSDTGFDLLNVRKLTIEQYGSNELGEWHVLKSGDKRLLL